MKVSLAVLVLLFISNLEASAQSCVYRSPNPSACGDGLMRITIENGMGRPSFLLHFGDVHCWFATYDLSGTLSQIDSSHFALIANGFSEAPFQREIGQIQFENHLAVLNLGNTDPRNGEPSGLQRRTYELYCKDVK